MSRYDGLIIPRSYGEYINKTDAATLLQALQLSGVMDNAPTANSNHPIKSKAVYNLETFALTRFYTNVSFDRESFPQDEITIEDLIKYLRQRGYIETKSLVTGHDGVHLILNFVNSIGSAWTFKGANLRGGYIEFFGAFIGTTAVTGEERYIMKIYSTASKRAFIVYKLPNTNPVTYEINTTERNS